MEYLIQVVEVATEFDRHAQGCSWCRRYLKGQQVRLCSEWMKKVE